VGTFALLVSAFGAPAIVAASRAAEPAPHAPSPAAKPLPEGNTFPVPAPYEVSFSDGWHACRDGCSRRHQGTDVLADEGAPEVAVESGVIAKVSNTDTGKAGLDVWLLGDSGNAYFYAHNSANVVTVGQRVERGEVIAFVGHTGNARGTHSHVHFQINRCGALTSDEPCTVDPYPLLSSWPQEPSGAGADAIGLYDAGTATFALRAESGSALPTVRFGRVGDLPIAGDWDGDGRDTIGTFRPFDATFRLRDANGNETSFVFGPPNRGGVPVVGDWDGDGRDEVGVYERADATFHLRDAQGNESAVIQFGPAGDDVVPIAGDWDGDGRDTVGVYVRSSATFSFRDGGAPAGANATLQYGAPGDMPIAGDWDGAGRDTVGVYHAAESTFHLQGAPDAVVAPIRFGTPSLYGSLPLAGDWNGRDLVTNDDLGGIFGADVAASVSDGALRLINAAMTRAGVVTPARKAAFLTSVYGASHFALDATAPGNATYRGRGLVQLTGRADYRRAGAELGVNLVKHPELATNPFVSAAVASWFWSVAHSINLAADHLDIAAVNIVMGSPATPIDDYSRCTTFVTALRWFNGGAEPDGVVCDRNVKSPWAALAALPPAALEALMTPAPPAIASAPPAVPPPAEVSTGRIITGPTTTDSSVPSTSTTPTTATDDASTTTSPTSEPSTSTSAPATEPSTSSTDDAPVATTATPDG
jgi:predicted chitinase/murein DD-endopeptidase MepM/ murein hydrolase activator NlpD